MRIYVDGKLYGKDDARVSVFDHGFLYGDGVFEGIRVYDGCVFRLKEHLQRLYASAKSLALEIPLSYEEMRQAVLDTVAANEARDAYIRLVVSRGAGDLGIDPANCARPTVVIIVGGIKLYPPELHEKGVTLITSSLRRIPLDSLDPRIKSLNYMNNILAKIEAKRAGAHEAVLLNHQGMIAECSADNLFLVTRGVLQTPDLIHGALPGITRACVLELAASLEIPAVQCALAMHDVYNADEAFVTGTGAEVVAAVSADGRTIGDGRPGPITRKLIEAFRHARTRDGAKVVYAGAV